MERYKSNGSWGWIIALVVGLFVIRGCADDGRKTQSTVYNRSYYSQPYSYVGSKSHVAENRSYSGQISEYTGRPKTVHVRGYYRKNGTYIRSHYRSPARRR